MFSRFYFSLVVVLALVCLSCDSVPLLAPTNSTVTIDAQSRVVAPGGTTEITATVLESGGTPVQNGTLVRFSTTLGRLDPAEAQTRNGIAVSTFLAGTDSGIAEVKATSGGAGSTATNPPGTGTTPGASSPTNSNIVLIAVGSAAVDTVTVRANPSIVPSTGGTVDVVATVVGANGRLLQGIPVSFSATRGTLSSSSALTDGNGDASVKLTTSADTQVTATAGSKTSTAPATVTALVAPAVTLTCAVGNANCSAVTVGQSVTFTATRTAGAIVSSTLDFGDGASVDLGALSGATAVPHPYGQAGSYTARLTARDANGETTSAVQVVQVLAQAAVDVAVSINGLTVTATATASAPVSQYQFTFEAGATQTSASPTANHTYAGAGLKTLTVVVTFVDGRTVTVTRTFTV